MRGKAGVVCLVSMLAACAAPQGPPPAGPGVATVVGTPFLIAFKIPVCVATVALAAPLAGATGLAPTPQAANIRLGLDESMAQNCGPPYVLPAD